QGDAAQAKFEAPPAGLAKRDYIPLALAIFVDLCLLLVSMGRPMNRFGGLVDKMREAEKGPVIRILSRFNDIHKDPDVRQNFEVFRHVVFDYHGAYYVAVPLDTPYNRVDPRSGQVMHYGASDAQDLQHEAHLLSNLFASFEKEKIFTRVYSPLLSTRMIQKRLARQGSKFAGSSAFRLYRFKDGAWSDVILGAVMGAARRVEEAQRRTGARLQTVRDAEGPRTDDVAAQSNADTPGVSPTPLRAARPTDMQQHGSQPVPPWQKPAGDEISRRRTQHAEQAPKPERHDNVYQSQFGSYAASARAELYQDDEDEYADVSSDAPAANNNTRPSQRVSETAARNAQVISLPQRIQSARDPSDVNETHRTDNADIGSQVGGDINSHMEARVTPMGSGSAGAVAINTIDPSETSHQATVQQVPPPLPNVNPIVVRTLG
ncbi:MAG: hypothetical protein AAFQ99_10770, partial [Pseudomonadota bacterium]